MVVTSCQDGVVKRQSDRVNERPGFLIARPSNARITHSLDKVISTSGIPLALRNLLSLIQDLDDQIPQALIPSLEQRLSSLVARLDYQIDGLGDLPSFSPYSHTG